LEVAVAVDCGTEVDVSCAGGGRVVCGVELDVLLLVKVAVVFGGSSSLSSESSERAGCDRRWPCLITNNPFVSSSSPDSFEESCSIEGLAVDLGRGAEVDLGRGAEVGVSRVVEGWGVCGVEVGVLLPLKVGVGCEPEVGDSCGAEVGVVFASKPFISRIIQRVFGHWMLLLQRSSMFGTQPASNIGGDAGHRMEPERVVGKGSCALHEVEDGHFIRVLKWNSQPHSRCFVVIFRMDRNLGPWRVKGSTSMVCT
jgi:hypothetical protein